MVEAAVSFVVIALLLEGVCRVTIWFRWRRQPKPFALPLSSLPAGIGLALVIAVGITETIASSVTRVTIAGIAGGGVLFASGWLLRYPAETGPNPVGRLLYVILPGLRWDRPLNVRHLRYAGLWAEGLGLAIVLGAPGSICTAAIGLPIMLLAAIGLEEDLDTRRYPPNRRMYVGNPALVTPRLALAVLGVAAIVFVSVGAMTRETGVFNSDADTAQTLLLSLAGAQLTFLLFVLSALAIGVQFLSTAYSWRAVQRVLVQAWPVAAACCAVFASALADVVVVSNGPDILADPRWIGAAVDGAFLLAGVVGSSLLVAVLTIRGALTAEGILARLLRSLTDGWIKAIRTEWVDREHLWTNDPFPPSWIYFNGWYGDMMRRVSESASHN
jgi:protein-S-isoprenylcysteine O-methyltransferase Ste14